MIEDRCFALFFDFYNLTILIGWFAVLALVSLPLPSLTLAMVDLHVRILINSCLVICKLLSVQEQWSVCSIELKYHGYTSSMIRHFTAKQSCWKTVNNTHM